MKTTPKRERHASLAATDAEWAEATATLAARKTLPPANKPGRPTVRTEATAKIICECLARGLPHRMACAVAGISTQTYTSWREDDAVFREKVERAVAEGVDARLKVIEKASRLDDWRASAWLLEHTQPQHFARNRLEVTGADGAPLAAGIQLYLPKKDGQAGEVVETKEIGNGNH